MTRRPGNIKFAFTLVELLVVIAIIGILAALMQAAVSQARSMALRIQCANNVRQLGILLASSVSTFNVYPLTVNPEHNFGGHYWVQVLQYNELSDPTNDNPRTWLAQGVWKCPAANTGPPWPTNQVYFSYGYNGLGMAEIPTNGLGLGGWSKPPMTAPRVRESEIVSPGDMMAIGDGIEGGMGILKDGEIALWRSASLTLEDYAGSTKRAYALHRDSANVVFCDGHVEAPTLQFLFADTSDAALRRWNRDHLPHRENLPP